MNYQLAKRFLCSVIVLVLVYYSVAWAVLRCSHEDDFTNAEVVSDASTYGARQDGAHLDCMGSEYYTETLAGVSASLEQRVLSTDIASHATDLSNLHGTGTAENGNLWLSALFDHRSVHSSRIGLPLYLSISVLRI